MNVNLLTAISYIAINQTVKLRSFGESRTRANSMGESLENYVKDIFAETYNETNEQRKLEKFERVFSYQGNQNNPPDIIIRNGDAIEVKKIENPGSPLALNSSYPKAKLFADSPMITSACRNCEVWQEKDILYTIGVVRGSRLSRLFFVYGVDYAASAEIYERIKSVINTGVTSIPDVEFAETKELGRVNRVDPLGITYLRIRGMWGIENPEKVFSYINEQLNVKPNAKFELKAIVNTEKYNSFPQADRDEIEHISKETAYFKVSDVKIKTPDNPSVLKSAKFITLQI